MLLADRRPEWQPSIARWSRGWRRVRRDVRWALIWRPHGRPGRCLAARARRGRRGRSHSAVQDDRRIPRRRRGQAKTSGLLRTLGLVLEDLLLLKAGTPELVRNVDLRPELEKMAAAVSFHWIEAASHGLDGVPAACVATCCGICRSTPLLARRSSPGPRRRRGILRSS